MKFLQDPTQFELRIIIDRNSRTENPFYVHLCPSGTITRQITRKKKDAEMV